MCSDCSGFDSPAEKAAKAEIMREEERKRLAHQKEEEEQNAKLKKITQEWEKIKGEKLRESSSDIDEIISAHIENIESLKCKIQSFQNSGDKKAMLHLIAGLTKIIKSSGNFIASAKFNNNSKYLYDSGSYSFGEKISKNMKRSRFFKKRPGCLSFFIMITMLAIITSEMSEDGKGAIASLAFIGFFISRSRTKFKEPYHAHLELSQTSEIMHHLTLNSSKKKSHKS